MFKDRFINIAIRILARAIDGGISMVLFLGIFSLANTDIESLHGGLLAIIFVVWWLLLEAVLFMVFGTTPGKKILAVEVSRVDGQPLNKLDIIKRTIGLSILGFGTGYPYIIVAMWLVNVVVIFISGKTLYDRIGGYVVEIAQVRKTRIIIAVILFILLGVLAVIGEQEGNTIVIYN